MISWIESGFLCDLKQEHSEYACTQAIESHCGSHPWNMCTSCNNMVLNQWVTSDGRVTAITM